MLPRPRRRLSFGRRTALQAGSAACSALVAVLLARHGWSVPADKAEVLWQLGFGLFSTVLTAHTIVFAVSADAESVWPSFTDVIRQIGLPAWLVIGLLSVLVAAGGDIDGQPEVINAGLALVTVQSVLGVDTLLNSLRALGGDGRRRFLAELVTSDLRKAAETGDPVRLRDQIPVQDYLSGIETAIDRGDVAALSQRAHEIGLRCRTDQDSRLIRWRLALLTYLVERLGRAVLYDNLTGDAARVALPQLIDGTLQASYRLAELTLPATAVEMAINLAWNDSGARVRPVPVDDWMNPQRPKPDLIVSELETILDHAVRLGLLQARDANRLRSWFDLAHERMATYQPGVDDPTVFEQELLRFSLAMLPGSFTTSEPRR